MGGLGKTDERKKNEGVQGGSGERGVLGEAELTEGAELKG